MPTGRKKTYFNINELNAENRKTPKKIKSNLIEKEELYQEIKKLNHRGIFTVND